MFSPTWKMTKLVITDEKLYKYLCERDLLRLDLSSRSEEEFRNEVEIDIFFEKIGHLFNENKFQRKVFVLL